MHTGDGDVILDYDFHPPDDLRLFAFAPGGVLRLDDEALVVEADYDGTILRHYAFRDRWFKVNRLLDPFGAFVEETRNDGAAPFSFNCDISTPMVRQGNRVLAVDLWLDVLVRSDGVTFTVTDRDRFEAAIERGLLSDRKARGAEAGLRDLVGLIEDRRLVNFLSEVWPFRSFRPSMPPAAIPMQRADPTRNPILQPGSRPIW